MRRSEKELDIALATALKEKPELIAWLLSRTKFAGKNLRFHSCRSNYIWGSHPFTAMNPDTGEQENSTRQSETDVLLLLVDGDDKIFAIHIENKLGAGAFTKLQPEMYEQRARHWIGNPKYDSYQEFDTVLLAPSAFRDRHENQVKHFGCFISHEEMARYAPEFGGT